MSVSRSTRLLVTTGIAENQAELKQFQHEMEGELEIEDISLNDVRGGTRE